MQYPELALLEVEAKVSCALRFVDDALDLQDAPLHQLLAARIRNVKDGHFHLDHLIVQQKYFHHRRLEELSLASSNLPHDVEW